MYVTLEKLKKFSFNTAQKLQSSKSFVKILAIQQFFYISDQNSLTC